MFDTLSDKLHDAFRKLRGQAVISETNIADAMKDIRLALLDADVNYDVAKDFVESIKAESLGQAVLKSVTPGQQIIKIVNDKTDGANGRLGIEVQPQFQPISNYACRTSRVR